MKKLIFGLLIIMSSFIISCKKTEVPEPIKFSQVHIDTCFTNTTPDKNDSIINCVKITKWTTLN